MKILHVAVFSEHSTNVWQAKGFEKLGHEIIRFDYRAMAKKLGVIGRDHQLVRLCNECKPNIILFAKCNQMNVGVVQQCSFVGTTVLWSPDCLPSMDTELIEKMKSVDFVFGSSAAVMREAKKYCKNVFKLYGGYDPDIHHPIPVLKTRDVAFIGNVHTYHHRPYRRQLWDAVGFQVINGVYGKHHSRVVSETKINLSLCDGRAVSNRIFKLMAAGGFVLANPWQDMHHVFRPGHDFAFFETADELKSQIKYYLEHSDKRKQIAANGYKAVKRFDNINYAKTIIEKVRIGRQDYY